MAKTTSSSTTSYRIPFLKPDLPYYPYGFGAHSVPASIGRWEMRKKDWAERYEWKENKPFMASMKIIRSQNPNRIIVENNDGSGARYCLSFTNAFKVLQKGTIVYGDVYGKWKFRKNGNSYSLVPIFD